MWPGWSFTVRFSNKVQRNLCQWCMKHLKNVFPVLLCALVSFASSLCQPFLRFFCWSRGIQGISLWVVKAWSAALFYITILWQFIFSSFSRMIVFPFNWICNCFEKSNCQVVGRGVSLSLVDNLQKQTLAYSASEESSTPFVNDKKNQIMWVLPSVHFRLACLSLDTVRRTFRTHHFSDVLSANELFIYIIGMMP